MTKRTSYDELYTVLCAVVETATRRPTWRKGGIQARPNKPYAVVYISEGDGVEKPVVNNIQLDEPLESGEIFEQTPWGTSLINVQFEFYSGQKPNDTALMAAQRAKQALYIETRYWDLWEICALSGGVRIIDISAIFREDIEQRVEVRFNLYANIIDPLPLAEANVFDIQSQEIDVTEVHIDNTETNVVVTVNNTTDDSSS